MRLDDLPVSVDLPEPLSSAVVAYVEAEGGWQVVAADGPPSPVLHLASRVDGQRPTVVVHPGRVPAEALRATLLDGAVDCIGWPDERERILQVPTRLPTAHRETVRPALLRISGTAGGVGTSTVCLAVGGLLAWGGLEALVVGADDLLGLCGLGDWTGPGAAEVVGLDPREAAAEVAGLARPVAGVPGLTVLRGAGAAVEEVAGWGCQVVVVDCGTAHLDRAQLVCGPRDASLRRAADVTAPVLLAERGPLTSVQARRVLGRRPAALLPTSARVARAGLAGRVPAALPGSWLDVLRKALQTTR